MLTKDNLDLFINLLEEASSTQDPKKLTIIQESLENLSKDLNVKPESSEEYSKSDEMIEKLEKVKELIVKLDTNNNFGNNLFQEFKEFLDNRKIK